MMNSGRASIFDDESGDDIDLSGFEPKKPLPDAPVLPPEKVREVTEASNFVSRSPVRAKPQPEPPPRRGRRTGRNMQLNIKATQQTVNAFYRITDSQGWVLGETLERALEALERELVAAAPQEQEL
jgi:hypothetical protein